MEEEPGEITIQYAQIFDENENLIIKHFPPDSPWVPNGRYVCLDETGKIRCKIAYLNGTAHGDYVSYWRNGKISSKGKFVDGKVDGEWVHYKQDGTISEIITFVMGKEIPRPLW